MTILIDAAGTHYGVNLIRPRSAAPFEPSDIALAGVVMPHLQHSVELGRRLRQADLLASAAFATLDALRDPVLLLDQDCRVLHINAAAEALLGRADGLAASQAVLHGPTQACTDRLHRILARAAGAGGSHPRAGALRLPRPSGGTALALLAMPFRQETHWSLCRRPAILVSVTEPDAAGPLPGRLMAEAVRIDRLRGRPRHRSPQGAGTTRDRRAAWPQHQHRSHPSRRADGKDGCQPAERSDAAAGEPAPGDGSDLTPGRLRHDW